MAIQMPPSKCRCLKISGLPRYARNDKPPPRSHCESQRDVAIQTPLSKCRSHKTTESPRFARNAKAEINNQLRAFFAHSYPSTKRCALAPPVAVQTQTKPTACPDGFLHSACRLAPTSRAFQARRQACKSHPRKTVHHRAGQPSLPT